MPDHLHVIDFIAEQASDVALVGGKAASLGRMVKAGFPVPPGFTVATPAYTAFMARIVGSVNAILQEIDYNNAQQLEEHTARIRALIVDAGMPAEIASAITHAYSSLDGGKDRPFVAVRSSGTAEDLAEASFAGLHDTFLDVRGDEDVLRAVRRCWASLWTARAVQYRHDKGFAHEQVKLAVVVQRMVPSEVAGVLFTANPLNLRTDEFVVNANWGLGESVVSGIVTPDEFIVDRRTLTVKARTLGTKEIQVVRDPAGQGAHRISVPPQKQAEFTLPDEGLSSLADLGRRVMNYYDGLPQDIEWGYWGGKFYLLQSRPVTGVEFTWDEDINDAVPAVQDEETVWTCAWADDFLTGGLTPLFFSMRVGGEFQRAFDFTNTLYGFNEIAGKLMCKYRRATAYFNCNVERDWNILSVPSALRNCDYVPHTWDEDLRKADFDWSRLAHMLIRMHQDCPSIGALHWLSDQPGGAYHFMKYRVEEANGPSPEELRALSDDQLEEQIKVTQKLADDWLLPLWNGFNFWGYSSLSLLALFIKQWYDGTHAAAYQSLISGMPNTLLVQEARAQWYLAQTIRKSPALRALIETHEGAAFFDALPACAEGRAFLDQYRGFLREHGHRGHQDRDFYYKRRIEDPAIDYRMLKAYLAADDQSSPEQTEQRMIATREAVTREVVENIRGKPDGQFKARLFELVLAYVHKFLVLRDDERHYYDRVSYQTKKVYAELGRRMFERGLFEEEDDFYFLCVAELRAVLEGRDSRALTRAKVKARKRVFHRFNRREEWTPPYLKGGNVLDLKARTEALSGAGKESGGGLRGLGTAAGRTTGRARVVPNLADIGRVKKGEILITNSTDPGWTPVFALISGLVLETGGLLAHGACLSREYGLPSVLLRNAMKLIPDGATITIDGSSGEVAIESEGPESDRAVDSGAGKRAAGAAA